MTAATLPQITDSHQAGVNAGWSGANFGEAYRAPLDVEAAVPGWISDYKGDEDVREQLVEQFHGGYEEGVSLYEDGKYADGSLVEQ